MLRRCLTDHAALRAGLVAAWLSMAATCRAADAAPPTVPAADPPPRALLASQQPPSVLKPPTDEPVVRRNVVEDDGSRIEEVNVRGAVRSITVKPKGPIKAEYEIVPTDASHDPSDGPSSLKGAQGQRVWRVLTF